MSRLTDALLELSDAAVDRVRAWWPFQREDAGAYHVRWTYVTKDKDWAKLLAEQPELHELAHPNVVDLALDPNGDHVFLPTPNGGVTAVIVLAPDQAERLLDAWQLYVQHDDIADEDDEERMEACDKAGDFIDEWVHIVLEHIEDALDDARDTWESDVD